MTDKIVKHVHEDTDLHLDDQAGEARSLVAQQGWLIQDVQGIFERAWHAADANGQALVTQKWTEFQQIVESGKIITESLIDTVNVLRKQRNVAVTDLDSLETQLKMAQVANDLNAQVKVESELTVFGDSDLHPLILNLIESVESRVNAEVALDGRALYQDICQQLTDEITANITANMKAFVAYRLGEDHLDSGGLLVDLFLSPGSIRGEKAHQTAVVLRRLALDLDVDPDAGGQP